jgi:GNAT superfamily N-acetyltransferase
MITIGTSTPPPGATLRRAGPADRTTLATLARATGLAPDAAGEAARLLEAPGDGATWLVEVHAMPAACVAVRWGEAGGPARVAALGVVPAHRGHGLGSWALDVAGAACRARGRRELRLDVDQLLGAVATAPAPRRAAVRHVSMGRIESSHLRADTSPP